MLNVKIDTKEKFTVLTLETADISANMSASLTDQCKTVLNSPQKNLVLNLENVESMEVEVLEALTESQQFFYIPPAGRDQHAQFSVEACGVENRVAGKGAGTVG